jgi:hypothetical protein
MNGENRPLVTDEPVEFEKQLVSSSRLQEDYSSIQNNLWNIPQINEEKCSERCQHLTGWPWKHQDLD